MNAHTPSPTDAELATMIASIDEMIRAYGTSKYLSAFVEYRAEVIDMPHRIFAALKELTAFRAERSNKGTPK